MLMHDFEKTRKYANHKSGAAKGSTETITRRIYLNIYYSHVLLIKNMGHAIHVLFLQEYIDIYLCIAYNNA